MEGKFVGEKFLWELLGEELEVVEFHAPVQVCGMLQMLWCVGMLRYISLAFSKSLDTS